MKISQRQIYKLIFFQIQLIFNYLFYKYTTPSSFCDIIIVLYCMHIILIVSRISRISLPPREPKNSCGANRVIWEKYLFIIIRARQPCYVMLLEKKACLKIYTASEKKGRIRISGFLRIFTVAFLLFLVPARGSNPEGPIS